MKFNAIGKLIYLMNDIDLIYLIEKGIGRYLPLDVLFRGSYLCL